MKANNETLNKLERFLSKIAQKLPFTEEPTVLTDIHLRLSAESGELKAYDDNDKEITRCVVDEWIDSREENFYDAAAQVMRGVMQRMHEQLDRLGVLRPYSFVLEDEDGEHVAELYLVDSDIKIIGGDLMDGLDADLDRFLAHLLED